MGLFDIDGKLMKILGRIVEMMELGVLFLITSIPIITIGASLSACYTLTFQMAKNEEGYVLKPYLKAFKANFKKATVLWLIMLFIGVILLGNFWAMSQVELAQEGIIKGLMWFLLFVFIWSGNYLFALQSQFENTVKATLKNALFLSFLHMIPSLLAFLTVCVPIYLLYNALQWYPFVVWLSVPVVCYVQSLIFVPVFRKYQNNDEKKEDNLVE